MWKTVLTWVTESKYFEEKSFFDWGLTEERANTLIKSLLLIFWEGNSKLKQFVSIAEFYLEFYLGIKQRDW